MLTWVYLMTSCKTPLSSTWEPNADRTSAWILFLERIELFSGYSRVKGNDDSPFLSSILSHGAIGQQAFFLMILFYGLPVFQSVCNAEPVKWCGRKLMCKISRVGRNKMDPGVLINPAVISFDQRQL